MPSIAADQAMQSCVHVAVGVIVRNNQVCVTQRQAHQHQGGKWEFPGGKLEAGETAQHALARELHEELGIQVITAEPLLTITYQYPDKHVLLDVWRVTEFSGQATARESQALQWQDIYSLDAALFPAANRAIIHALMLPTTYVITGAFNDPDDFESKLLQCLHNGQRLIQLRAKHLSQSEYNEYAAQAGKVIMHFAQQHDLSLRARAKLLLNTALDVIETINADGVHLTSDQLMQSKSRPLVDKLVGASVHNEQQLEQACRLGVDFVVISPVFNTPSHPDATPLGWSQLHKLVTQSSVPVYALGGMQQNMLSVARSHGAFGVAGISDFWP